MTEEYSSGEEDERVGLQIFIFFCLGYTAATAKGPRATVCLLLNNVPSNAVAVHAKPTGIQGRRAGRGSCVQATNMQGRLQATW